MHKNVLILATRHDSGSARTFQWAEDLRDKLYVAVDHCIFLDATGLCRGGSTLSELIQTSTHVVFYGHGEKDSWTALPGSPPTPLIEVGTVNLLDGRQVYAGCCWSLSGLGHAFSQNCNGDFVGYDDQFGFETKNEVEFKNIVNQSVINFVLTGNAATTVSDLQQEWTSLDISFATGHLRLRPDAIMAGAMAKRNRLRIGSKP